MKTLIQDKVYSDSMLIRLDQSGQKIQSMVDEWNLLGYKSCDSNSMLYDLSYNSQQMIEEGRKQKELDGDRLTPAGREDYLRKLVFKDPHNFKVAAVKVGQDAFSERGQGLWSVKSGAVTLDKKAAAEILQAKSVVAQNDRQFELGQKVIQICDLFNEVNRATYGTLKFNLPDLFNVDLRPGSNGPATINIEILRRVISTV